MGALPILPSISSPTALLISGKRRRDETTEREMRPFSYFSFEGNHSPDLLQAFKNDFGIFSPTLLSPIGESLALFALLSPLPERRASLAQK